MSKSILKTAILRNWSVGEAPKLSVTLQINGREVEIDKMPCSNELIKELTATFKRHLPKQEDI